MYQLSKREKLLLSILAVLASGVGIAGFLLMPALDKRLEYQERLRTVQSSQLTMQKASLRYDEWKAESEKKKGRLEEEAAVYYEKMNTETVGELLVSMLDASRLYARSMSLSPPAPKAITYSTQLPTDDTDFFSEKRTSPDLVEVLCSRVNGEAVGDNAAVRSFLDSVESNASMQMKAFSILEDESTAQYVIKYEIDVYMIHYMAQEPAVGGK